MTLMLGSSKLVPLTNAFISKKFLLWESWLSWNGSTLLLISHYCSAELSRCICSLQKVITVLRLITTKRRSWSLQ